MIEKNCQDCDNVTTIFYLPGEFWFFEKQASKFWAKFSSLQMNRLVDGTF